MMPQVVKSLVVGVSVDAELPRESDMDGDAEVERDSSEESGVSTDPM